MQLVDYHITTERPVTHTAFDTRTAGSISSINAWFLSSIGRRGFIARATCHAGFIARNYRPPPETTRRRRDGHESPCRKARVSRHRRQTPALCTSRLHFTPRLLPEAAKSRSSPAASISRAALLHFLSEAKAPLAASRVAQGSCLPQRPSFYWRFSARSYRWRKSSPSFYRRDIISTPDDAMPPGDDAPRWP